MSSKKQNQVQENQVQEKSIRLETDKKLWIATIEGNEYVIISGMLKGKVKREKHTVLDTRNKRTPEQEAMREVSKMVEVRIKQGYQPKNKAGEVVEHELEAFMGDIRKALVSTAKIDRLNKQLEKAKDSAKKVATRLKKQTARINKIQNEINALTA